jgi:hypothetical protein
MSHLRPPIPEGAQPLRRLDRYAIIQYLGRKERNARLVADNARVPGTLNALVQNGLLCFQLRDPDRAQTSGFQAGGSASILFRVRGLDFRAEGAVRRADTDKGRLLFTPEFIEWTVGHVKLCDTSYATGRALLRIRTEGKRSLRLDVLVLEPEQVYFLCWPCPKGRIESLCAEAVLEHPDLGTTRVSLSPTGSSPVYPGCQGRIVKASVVSGGEGIEAMLDRLEPAPDRRDQLN